MKTLAEIRIDKLFSGMQIGMEDRDVQYCRDCGTVFQASWKTDYKFGYNKWYGWDFCCPSCQTRQFDYLHRNLNAFRDKNDTIYRVPFTAMVKVVQHTNILEVIMYGECVCIANRGLESLTSRYQERFIFDIKAQKAYYSSDKGERFVVNNLISSELYLLSMMRFLQFGSYAWPLKKQFMELSKTLRKALYEMCKKHLGYGPKTTFVQPSRHGGLLLPQLLNLTWRLAVTDAPNLGKITAGKHKWDRYGYWNCDNKDSPVPRIFKTSIDACVYLNSIMDDARTGLSFPQSALKILKIADSKAYRSAIAKAGDVFYPKVIKLCAKLSDTTADTTTLFSMLREDNKFAYIFNDKSKLAFFIKMKNIFGSRTIIEALKVLLTREDIKRELEDCITMYGQLNDAHRQKFHEMTFKGRQLHDVLARVHGEQGEVEHDLNIPEHVVKRLGMQLDSVQFFIPQSNISLKNIGVKLHNCVGSYAARVKAGDIYIVGMTDDRGKLVACIEICKGKKQDSIIQAKLNQNKPVCNNAAINLAILDWAKKVNLKISTCDISELSKSCATVAV